MSTKRLQRSVIEGGRDNTFERRHSHSEQRSAERDYLLKIKKDPESFDKILLGEKGKVSKSFKDKLNPMERWLEAQIGRPWDEVRSEVFEKFDTRTTAGRHITFDHLLSSVVDTASGRDSRGFIASNYCEYRTDTYYVDDSGLLQKHFPKSRYLKPWQTNPELIAAGEWLRGRMIGELGGVLSWFTTNDGIWKSEWSTEIEKRKYGMRSIFALRYRSYVSGEYTAEILNERTGYEQVTLNGFHWKWIANPVGFKQRGPLSKEEVEVVRSFSPYIQEEILKFGRTRF